jgi:hypothetical protein
MTTYSNALRALEYLLDKVGEIHWRDWLREDMALWVSSKEVAHHLSGYGGMGSLNDLWICAQNGHALTELQEPWVNRLLTLFRNLCFQLAHTPLKERNIGAIVGKSSFSIFGIFFRGRRFPSSGLMPKWIAQANIHLNCWRCLNCNYKETHPRSIEDVLAEVILPCQISLARTEQELIVIVDNTLSFGFPETKMMREQLKDAIQKNGVAIVERNGWMRPCPRCGSQETEVCKLDMYLGNPYRLNK